ncbi:MAG: polysaccharide deacetylase family protein [Eubacteriales bacterium]
MTAKALKTLIILIIIFQMVSFTIIDIDSPIILKTAEGTADQNSNEYYNAQNVVPILMYHAIEEKPWGMEQLFVRDSEFEKQIKYLSDNGYTPILFDDLENYESYKNPVIITFDDGYRDNYYNAYPILKKYNFKAVVFLIVNCLNSPEYLSKEQISEMKDIISFQSHTLNHFLLTKINNKALETECLSSKSIIEELTGVQVNVLSYPYGKYSQAVIETVSGYYDYAVTTKSGYYDKTNDNYKIKRIRIQRSDTLKSFINKLHAE